VASSIDIIDGIPDSETIAVGANCPRGLAGIALDGHLSAVAGGPTAGLSVAGTSEVFTP